MVIVHAYRRLEANIVASPPLRYNNGDDMPVTARELVLDVSQTDTLDAIRQRIVKKFDEEKQDVSDEQSGSMSSVITIE